jgi:hypothetical protein
MPDGIEPLLLFACALSELKLWMMVPESLDGDRLWWLKPPVLAERGMIGSDGVRLWLLGRVP